MTNNKIVEKQIKIEVFNYTKEYGYYNSEKMSLLKQKGKDAEILYPSIQTLKLTNEQESLLMLNK